MKCHSLGSVTMKLVPTRRTDYGIRALIFLARHPGTRSKASEIGGEMEMPTGFLQQVLQELQRARLVTSRSGPQGGYSLARDPGSITIREIVEALEGPIELQECALRGGPCRWDEVCALHWVWSGAQRTLKQSLESATLARIAADDTSLAAGTAAIPEDSHRRGDPSKDDRAPTGPAKRASGPAKAATAKAAAKRR
jgi:Rrf2 family protein